MKAGTNNGFYNQIQSVERSRRHQLVSKGKQYKKIRRKHLFNRKLFILSASRVNAEGILGTRINHTVSITPPHLAGVEGLGGGGRGLVLYRHISCVLPYRFYQDVYRYFMWRFFAEIMAAGECPTCGRGHFPAGKFRYMTYRWCHMLNTF